MSIAKAFTHNVKNLMAPIGHLLRGAHDAHPLLRDNNAYFKSFDQTRPLAQYHFVVFDTELTGLNPKRDEIVSIGAVRIHDLKIVAGENYYARVRPIRPIPKDSTLIHRISPQQIEDAPPLSEILPDFLRFCDYALLVGHYVGLDITFVNRALHGILRGQLANPCIDTMRLARVYREEQWGHYYDQFNYRISYNLADLAKEYHLPTFAQHDALEDAFQTAYLFLFLVKKLQERGLETLKDLFWAGKTWRWIY